MASKKATSTKKNDVETVQQMELVEVWKQKGEAFRVQLKVCGNPCDNGVGFSGAKHELHLFLLQTANEHKCV